MARMRRVRAVLVAGVLLGAVQVGTAGARAGDLDPSFGVDGRQRGPRALVVGAAWDSLDRTVLAGRTLSSNEDVVVARYTTGGVLDPAFSGDGVVRIALGDGRDTALVVAVQPDDKVVVAGITSTDLDNTGFVLRLTAAGGLDPSFGTDGVVRLPFEGWLKALAVDGAGRLVGGGWLCPDDCRSTLLRFTPEGDIDATFGVDDGATLPDRFDILEIDVLPGGAIIVGGDWVGRDGWDLAVSRRLADGSADNGFGERGLAVLSLHRDDRFRGLAVDPGGSVLVAGSTTPSEAQSWLTAALVARLTPSGQLDATFASDGFRTFDVGPGSDVATSVALQPDGRIVVGGSSWTGWRRSSDFLVARLTTTGAADLGFGGYGTVLTTFAGHADSVVDVHVQADGRIVAAGTTTSFTPEVALARYAAENGRAEPQDDGARP
jgi:uncharacterized delta-60 repeat protein